MIPYIPDAECSCICCADSNFLFVNGADKNNSSQSDIVFEIDWTSLACSHEVAKTFLLSVGDLSSDTNPQRYVNRKLISIGLVDSGLVGGKLLSKVLDNMSSALVGRIGEMNFFLCLIL